MQQPQQQPPAETGSFIVAIVVGLFAGGTGLTFFVFLLGLAIGAAVESLTHNGTLVALFASYAIAVALGVLAFFLVRRNVGFLSGFVVGAVAGLLGGISICAGVFSGLNNMH